MARTPGPPAQATASSLKGVTVLVVGVCLVVAFVLGMFSAEGLPSLRASQLSEPAETLVEKGRAGLELSASPPESPSATVRPEVAAPGSTTPPAAAATPSATPPRSPAATPRPAASPQPSPSASTPPTPLPPPQPPTQPAEGGFRELPFGAWREPEVSRHPIPEQFRRPLAAWDYMPREHPILVETLMPPEQAMRWQPYPANRLPILRPNADVDQRALLLTRTDTGNDNVCAMVTKVKAAKVQRPKSTIGMLMIADEKNHANRGFSCFSPHSSGVDFVVKHYWHGPAQFRRTPTVQLGTMACGRVPRMCDVRPLHAVFVSLLPPRGSRLPPRGQMVRASKRPRSCVWVGSLREDRAAMVAYFDRTKECTMMVQTKFGCCMDDEDYFAVHMESVFVAMPRGNSVEVHRLAETFMTGAIPVFVKTDASKPVWSSYERPLPRIVGNDWADAGRQMKALLADPVKLDAMQQEVLDWYDYHKACHYEDMRWILAVTEARVQGRDLCKEAGLK